MIYGAHFIKWLYPHTQATAQQNHYYNSNIRSYKYGGEQIQDIGWHGHTPSRINKISFSQTGMTHTVISMHGNLQGTLYEVVTPSYTGNHSTKSLLSK